jgi:asparagine synthase (glutamine-hydrolysing)
VCGFAGTLHGDLGRPADVRLAELLAGRLKHRGPDDKGSFSDGPYAVSHRRLNIIDLTVKGRQPMQNGPGTISIAYNGEVYNFRELREKHGLDRKFAFRSRTDTEVLLNLYETRGIDFVTANGMFALAIWDSRQKTLYLIATGSGSSPSFTPWSVTRSGSPRRSKGYCPCRVREAPCLEALYRYFGFNYIPGRMPLSRGQRSGQRWLEVRSGSGLETTSGTGGRPTGEYPRDLRGRRTCGSG